MHLLNGDRHKVDCLEESATRCSWLRSFMSVGERVNTWGLKETNLVIVIVMGMVIVTIMITSYREEHKGKLLEEER